MEEPSRSLKKLAELLKRKYLENPHIERLFYPDHPLPLEQCYLHLALIEEKEVKKSKEPRDQGMPKEQATEKEKSESEVVSQRDHLLRDYERIENIQRKLEVKDLLAEAKNTPRRIYIEGAAGAGKSTLSRYIVHQWALGKSPWNHYRWAYHIRLRELTANNYTEKNTELLKVLERECFELGHGNGLKKEEKELLERDMTRYPQQILLVLDGIDELQLTTNYIREVWQSLINSGYDLLFTSRHGAQLIKRDLRINFSLGVLGFSDEQIETCVKNFFDPKNTPNAKAEDAQKFLEVLRNNPNLWSLAHTPIQLELLCSIWGEELKQQELNLTDLYCLMLEKLLKRYEQLILKQQGQILNLDDIDIGPLQEKYQHQLHYMEYLAFQGMQEKIIVFNEKHINEAFNRLPKDSVKGVEFYRQLKGLGLIKRYNNGKQAEFVHLTFQEFFAARYIAKAITAFGEGKTEGLSHEALLEFIRQTKSDPFYEVMWWFVAGLLAGKKPQTQELQRYHYQASENTNLNLPKSHLRLQRLQTFFDLLLQEPRNPVRYQELLLLTRCLDEARMPEIMQKEAITNHIFYYYSQCSDMDLYSYKAPPQFQRIKSIIVLNPLFVKSNRLLFEKFLLERLKTHRYELINLIKLFPEKVFPALHEAIKDPDENIRNSAHETLRSIGSYGRIELFPEKVISALQEALKDPDKDIRDSAHKTLSTIGFYDRSGGYLLLEEEEQLEELQNNSHKERVNRSVASFLSNLEFQDPKNAISSLLEALKDFNDRDLRRAAAKKLGELGSHDLEKVIPALLEALKGRDTDVKCAAAEALGNIGSQALEKVVPALLEALKYPFFGNVSKFAAEALEKLGFQAPEKVIPTLLEAFNDPKSGMHNDAKSDLAEALGKLCHLAPEKVIPALLEALKDCRMCDTVANTLSEIGSIIPDKISFYLEHVIDNSFMPQERKKRKEIIILVLRHIKIISLEFLAFSVNELFPDQPPSVPPSCLIRSPNDTAKVDDKGKLATLPLCGEMMEAILKNNQETHVITQDFWTISIVRKRESARNNNASNASPGFFKSVKFTNGLFDHAFIIIEGVKNNVRFAKKIDFFAENSGGSQSSGQRIRIEVTDIDDFKRLENLAENCSCMMHGMPREKIVQLEEAIKRDQAAAKQGEIIYNMRGDGSFSVSRGKKEHSCISWCLEKWQELKLPLQRKWYDAIVVVPKAYLPAPQEQPSCKLI